MEKKVALGKLQAICSRQEKCIFDIKQKLNIWNVENDHWDEIIEALINDKYVDEDRYAQSFVNDKYKFNKWGRIKIQYQLKMKGVNDACIKSAIQNIVEEEYASILNKVITDKNKSIKDKDSQVRYKKLLSFAYNRGFSFEESNEVIKRVCGG